MVNSLAAGLEETAAEQQALPVLPENTAVAGSEHNQQESRIRRFLVPEDVHMLTEDGDGPVGKNQEVAAVEAGMVLPLTV